MIAANYFCKEYEKAKLLCFLHLFFYYDQRIAGNKFIKLRKILLFFLLGIRWQAGFSQQQLNRVFENNFNAWLVYSGDFKLSEKWGMHLGIPWRRNAFFSNPQQIIIRPGINYYFNKQVSTTVGYAFAESFPYGQLAQPATFYEHRVWEQVQFKNQIGKTEFTSRFRLEQRFSHLPISYNNEYKAGPAVYANRVRLFDRFSLPLKGRLIEDKSIYVSFFDEVYINFGRNVGYNIFDQNRTSLSIGYQFPKLGRLEVGYLNQLSLKSDGLKFQNNHTLQVALYSNISLYKSE